MSEANGDSENVTTIHGGGDMIFSPGTGKPSGNIVFILADEREMIRFDDNGKVFVRGEQVDDNKDIYMHFRRWLQLACITPPDKANGGSHDE